MWASMRLALGQMGIRRRTARVGDQDWTLFWTISMTSRVRGSGALPLRALVFALGLGALAGTTVRADGHDHHSWDQGRFKHNNLGYGTLGWAEYGLYPGLYGFSLRWHRGYGYGRYALGAGADGGYPFYGGPGYPHEPPRLNRCRPDAPFTYFGGPGYPIYGWSNFYQGIGGLDVTKPVVRIGEPGDLGYVGEYGERNPGADFGSFTGAIPYPETRFAPYAAAAAATGSSGAEGPARPALPPPAPRAPGGPSSSRSRPNSNLRIGIDATGRRIPADLPITRVSTERPTYLPPVGNGPPPATRRETST